MKDFKVILYSPKELQDYELFKTKCNNILENKLKNREFNVSLLTGDNNELAKKYAKEKELNLTIIPADWKTHGKLLLMVLMKQDRYKKMHVRRELKIRQDLRLSKMISIRNIICHQQIDKTKEEKYYAN